MKQLRNRESVETTRETSKYKVHIDKSIAILRAKKAWITRRKNKTDSPWNKGKTGLQIAWNKGLDKSDSRVLQYSNSMTSTIRKQFKNGRKQYIHTTETNNKMRDAKLGDKNPSKHWSPKQRDNARKVAMRVIKSMKWKATSIEKKLWKELESMEIIFYKNYHLKNRTIPDAYIPEKKIAIYADGDYWHNLPNWKERDIKINAWLLENGYRVVRLWEHEINSEQFPELLRMKI